MLHEKINLGNSGYGTRDTILTTYVQNNLEGVPARRRPAVIICPGGGYEYQSDRESEPIALEFLKRGYQAFILEYAVLEENETKGLLPYPQMDLAKAVAYVNIRRYGMWTESRLRSWDVRQAEICVRFTADFISRTGL